MTHRPTPRRIKMPITVDNAVTIDLKTFDFTFLMIGEAVFYQEDVDLTTVTYETEEGYTFSILDDGDEDAALEQWIEATVDAMAERVQEEWALECEQAGFEVVDPESIFYP